ncbi:MAG TPA: cytochrome P450 [Acidimicrobiales bacterium]|jgi:cytochrome P450|nr:cytochrome P450 [Acidimicrobiales bacterium]
MVSIAEAVDTRGLLFIDPNEWADMDSWHERVAEIRRTAPVLEVEFDEFSRFYVLTRHEDVFAVSRDNQHWLNTSWSVLGPDAQMDEVMASGMPLPKSLVHLDGTTHRDHRRVTNDWFKPAAVKGRQPRIDEIADHFVQKMRDLGGECDFAEDIAKPYTLHVIMDIYGVPEEDEPLMMELTQGIFGAADPEYLGDAEDPQVKLVATVMRYIQYFNEVTENRRACPVDDLATVIANGQIDGCPMGDEERLWYYIIVATAGHDTTSYALSGGLEAMLRDPDQIWALRDDPDLLVGATDEVIRWTAPVRHFMRYATEDMEVGGVTIPEGGRVLLSYPSANRDEDVFENSMTFDVRRTDADKLMSFGMGAHFCLGSQFARREVRTMLAKLSQQLDHIEPAGDPSWSLSHFVSGVKHLPVRYRFK